MKTIDKTQTAMQKIITKAEKTLEYLVPSPSTKMGGIRRLKVMRNGLLIHTQEKDERQYYKGRGAKYNSNINHETVIATVNISELNKAYAQYVLPKEKEIKKQNTKRYLKQYAKENINPFVTDVVKDCYKGAGDYIIAVKDGRITATVYGSYADTKPPYLESLQTWFDILKDELLTYGDVILGTGSGTIFYANNPTDLIETKTSIVPSARGGWHENIEIITKK